MVAIALRSRAKNSKRHEERLKEKLQVLDFFSKRNVEQSENVVQSENKSIELEVISLIVPFRVPFLQTSSMVGN